ncbi:hypothetical protein BN2476_350269 [Paraburkholderia piptadeniae]|uniref:Uncharacterized protein n=1 Tax=Paraburkholderia piptadeniae TaxID=1701573 RepID=A0A1N7S8P6_9BURK|nr:hypothetical protein [Paraburkholderia piptadeniae]SIT43745.1 hypothetical protein BN2476_350269 [Paraburkholderia piptadeniae]
MKSIFIFDDSRATELRRIFVALGEDGLIVKPVVFDEHTAPHFLYAMGVEHTFAAREEAFIAEAVDFTRKTMLRRYDEIYGAGNWIPLWLADPRSVAEWRNAMSIARQLATTPSTPTAFSDRALQGILRDVMGPASAPRGVTKH